jgi:tetratricopeptide (TPR) repeat protein
MSSGCDMGTGAPSSECVILDVMKRRLAHSLLAVCALAVGDASAATERWHVAQNDHFLVIGNGGPKQVRLVAQELEQLRDVFQSVLGLRVQSARPFLVLAAEDQDSLRKLVPWFWDRRRGSLPAGVFLAGEEKDWAILRADLESPTLIIYHEYAHLLTRLSLGPLPLWLDEGLAQFFASTKVGDHEVQTGEIDPNDVILLRRQLPLPVATLLAVNFGSAEYTERDRVGGFYAESAILTHYLLLGDDAKHRPRLDSFLKLVDEGVSEQDALVRAFGGAAALEGELRRYVRRLLFPVIRVPAAVSEEVIPLRELRPAEAAAFLADFLLHTGQVKQAQGYVEEALRAEPNLALGHLQRGSLLLHEGRHDEATSAFAEARRLAPRDALSQYRFGALGRPPLADAAAREEALRTAVRLAPGFAPPRGALARLLADEGRSLEEALGLAVEAARLDPRSVTYRVTLVGLATRLGRTQDAEREEKQLLRVVSSDPRALAGLVEHYESDGKPDLGEAVLRRVRTQSPRNLIAIQMLASFLERRGRPDEAEAALREGLLVERRSTTLLNNLAYLNADRGVNLPEALDLADKALKIEPNAPNVQDTKGWVLFRMGRLREAEEWTRKALSASEDPVVREHLGDILEKGGRPDEALAEWRAALANGNANEDQRRILAAKVARAEASAPPAH